MNFKYKKYFFVFLFFLYGCSTNALKDDIIIEKNRIKETILKKFPKSITVNILSFRNLSYDNDYDYLSQAIPELIYSYIKPLESENIYVSSSRVDFKPSDEIEKLLSISNSFFINYLITNEIFITQGYYTLITNSNKMVVIKSNFLSNYILITNIITNIISNIDIINNISDSYYTDYVNYDGYNFIQTNELISENFSIELISESFIPVVNSNFNPTNIIKTNILKLTENGLSNLIYKEFTELTNNIYFLPVVLKKELNTNIPIITNNYNYYIFGSYNTNLIDENGISGLVINVYLLEIANQTNLKEFTIFSYENKLSEDIYYVLCRDLKKMIINKPTGDLLIITEPEEANVYLDSVFIGKTPLFYPSVSAGSHTIIYLKPGYKQSVKKIDVIENMTNLLTTKIGKLRIGGIVDINSTPTNSRVFLNTQYIGKTPLQISNLTLGEQHRIKIIPEEKELKPYYTSIFLKKSNDYISINPILKEEEGVSQNVKNIAWLSAYGSWALTISLTIFNIYAHSLVSYYNDMLLIETNDIIKRKTYEENLTSWKNLDNYSSSLGLLSVIVSSWFTAYALSTDEIYLGFQIYPNKYIKSIFSFSF